jgi:hypothetical protein
MTMIQLISVQFLYLSVCQQQRASTRKKQMKVYKCNKFIHTNKIDKKETKLNSK